MAKSSYNATKLADTYFATLQQAKDNAVLLNIVYTDSMQLMYYAMKQFEKQLTREQAGKIERKWLDLPAETCTWTAFKMF
mmetsp:Transcript_5070/g.11288  ORF Transcript_5070/g.11288 Transcript_5070/m.11288 type:complete len:80 (-) Transcript_5070:625-864(-)